MCAELEPSAGRAKPARGRGGGGEGARAGSWKGAGLWCEEGFTQEGLEDQVALGRQRGSCPGSGEEP